MIVGVNRYRLAEEEPLDIRDIDNAGVREAQVARLARIRADARRRGLRRARWRRSSRPRPPAATCSAAAVEAARARATVGEISDAMEKVFGRHRAEVKTLAGVYGAAYEGDAGFAAIQADVEKFAEEEGRRPRMLVVKMGQDGHDRGAKVIATAFADIGFDVDVGPLFQTPEEAAQDAIDNDVHVVGISSQAAGHKTLAPKLIEALKAQGAGDILVICGGVIPQQDYGFLKDAGVSAIFGPGTNIPEAAREILGLIRQKGSPRPCADPATLSMAASPFGPALRIGFGAVVRMGLPEDGAAYDGRRASPAEQDQDAIRRDFDDSPAANRVDSAMTAARSRL